jgi:hypothetical protein
LLSTSQPSAAVDETERFEHDQPRRCRAADDREDREDREDRATSTDTDEFSCGLLMSFYCTMREG